MTARHPWLALACWVCSACGDNGLSTGSGPDAGVPDAEMPRTPSLQERVDDAVTHIKADTCFTQMDTSQCEWADYGVGPSFFNMAVSTGEAVLVIDGFDEGMYPQLVRWRNRIRGVYHVQDDGIVERNIAVHLPKQLGEALLSLGGPEFVSAGLLAPVSDAAGMIYGKLPLVFLGHGGVIFDHLVELTPEQPLVLLDLKGMLGLPPALCTVNPQTLAAAQAHFAAVASSLQQLIAAHNVHFINASFGDTVATMTTDWMQVCGTAVPGTGVLRQLLHLYDPVYAVLFHTPGVVTSHAAANLGDPADFPFDQVGAQYANRVRVGFISSRASGLDAQGRGSVQKSEQFPRDGDADVYLNWDCEAFIGCANPHYDMTGLFGLGLFNVAIMSTSYVNPLGLGRLIDLRYANHAAEPMSDALIQTLKSELTPALCGNGSQPCVYQDPVLHRQLEPYRLHYR